MSKMYRLLLFLSILFYVDFSATAQDSLADKYLDDDDGLVFEVDLTKILKSKDYQPLAKLIDVDGRFEKQTGISIQQIKLFALAAKGPDEGPLQRFVLDTNNNIDALQLMRINRWVKPNDVPETLEYRDKVYYAVENWRGKLGVFQPSDESLVVNSLEQVEEFVKGKRPKQSILRSKEWKEFADYDLRLAVGEKLYGRWREEYERFNESGGGNDPIAQLLVPINQKVEKAFGGLSFKNEVSLRVSLYAKNSTDAKDVLSSLEALVQIGKSMLKPLQAAAIASAPDEASKKMVQEAVALANRFVESLKFERNGREVRVTAKTDIRQFVRDVLPDALASARKSARRMQSANNLKQLGLSMHNFHDANKAFPPAVIIGPKGHKHSWRVAVLPYLDQKALYDQYRFDEPWDSPNNLKVMKQMPAVFRHPNDPPDSTNTRYLAFVGPGTPFGNPEGAKFRDILDGSSNTVMFFSGPSNVPWTKPEDIEYDPKKDPNLENGPYKEGFNAVMFDGSVEFLSKDLDVEAFHNLIQMNDGNPVVR